MPLPVLFFNLTAATGQNLDDDFAAVAKVAPAPCTITGTNNLTFTPIANVATISAYANGLRVSGIAAATNGGAVTAQVQALALLNVYKNTSAGPVALTGGEIAANCEHEWIYQSSLNSGAGGWILTNPITSSSTIVSAPSYFKNLVVTNTTAGTPNTQCKVTADAITVSDQASSFATLFTVSVTVSSGSAGANGLDTGAVAPSTWYAIYVIYNPTTATVAALMSLSATAPTLPAGYTMYARVGWMRTDGSSTFLRVMQKGRRAQYVVIAATNTVAMPNIVNGAAGTYNSTTAPVWVAVSITTFVPTATASAIFVIVTPTYNNLTGANVAVAPSNAYSGAATTNPPPLVAVPGTNSSFQAVTSIILEATSLQWASSAAGGGIFCSGWEDNL